MEEESFGIPDAILETEMFNRIADSIDNGRFEEALFSIGSRLGFEYFSIFEMRTSDLVKNEIGAPLNTNVHGDILNKITEKAAELRGSSSRSEFMNKLPFEMQIITEPQNSDVAPLRMMARSVFRSLFFTVPVNDFKTWLIVFSGNRHQVSEMELVNLHFWATVYCRKLEEKNSRELEDSVSSLTDRERECLEWTAKGKTSAEIGMILNLSEHTINNYLINACRRIKATNRSHAVYLAMKAGIIN